MGFFELFESKFDSTATGKIDLTVCAAPKSRDNIELFSRVVANGTSGHILIGYIRVASFRIR